MTLIPLNKNDDRFKLLVPKPLELISGEEIGKLVKKTSDGAYSCICPESKNIIDIFPNGEVRCDVGQKGRKTCGTVGLENEICTYNAYIK